MKLPEAGLLLLIVFLEGCNETPRAYYATAADAVTAGAMTRGWLPDVLNSDVSDIHESHDIDNNRGEARFRYTAGLIPRLNQKCAARPAAKSELNYQCGDFTLSLDPQEWRGHLSH